ncbi:MAG: DEAD/DEAH box helicase [Candidatus Heimdallarchaeota archaeon]|nr:DEAD/DEAH box helicase [Candidatus Heimdallarchaeota archaeon]
MKTSSLPIDDRISSYLIEKGIVELYPPQAEAVEKGLLRGRNQVIAIPTASGKTLIAILSMFSSLLQNGGKAIYLAPLRALASEKFDEFREFAKLVGLKVAISTGDLDEQSGWLGGADIIIATNEKFDSIIRHQVSWLDEIKVIVSDEVHLINDSSRGPVLEVVLSLIRRNLPECQIVALSATITNADEIAEWLDADLITSSWRPVKLVEGVWEGGTITYANGKQQELGDSTDRYGYVSLAMEMVDQQGQCLIFTNTRKSTMKSAEDVAKKIKWKLSNSQLMELKQLADEIRSLGEKTELRSRLADVIEGGVAFHHAGLISSHRKKVEDAFRSRQLKVITASPTLAAGINLPGRRVIIRSVTRYSDGFTQPIPVLEYKQMAGRAGRPQFDPYGEAIIIAKNESERDVFLDKFIRAETEEITSKLGTEPAMRSHILSFIASNYVIDFDTAMDMIANTFYGYQNDGSLFFVEEEVLKVLEILSEAKLISKDEPYSVTKFGKRVNELYLDPLSARMIKLGLEESKDKQLDNLVFLQLLSSTPDIRLYSIRDREIEELMEDYERYKDDWMNLEDEDTEYGYDLFFSSLKIAKVIELWLEEASEEEINDKYGIASGDLHALLNRMEWLVHSANEISKIFKWKLHTKTLNSINQRLKYGIKEELMPLVDIHRVGRVRARILYDHGYTSIEKINKASVDELAKIPGIGRQLASIIKEGISDESNGDSQENIPDQIQTSLDSFF